MTDRVPESQTGRWPWRHRCPDGHTSITLYVDRFRCAACGTSYERAMLEDLASAES